MCGHVEAFETCCLWDTGYFEEHLKAPFLTRAPCYREEGGGFVWGHARRDSSSSSSDAALCLFEVTEVSLRQFCGRNNFSCT